MRNYDSSIGCFFNVDSLADNYKNMRKKLILLIVFSCFILSGYLLSCETKENDIANKSLKGKWTLIRYKKEVYCQYHEIEFIEGNKMKVYSDDEELLGLMDYSIKDDIISFNNESFTLKKSFGKMEFRGNENKYILFRIPFDLDKINRDQINPIYVRKGYFLLHLNEIKVDSFVNYLNKANEPIDLNNMFKEEIPINN